MKKRLNPLLAFCLVWILQSCTVNRYFYVIEEKVDLFAFTSYAGNPVRTLQVGDTVSTTGTKTIQLGGPVPVEFKGYRYYTPYAKARFLRIAKVNPRRQAARPSYAMATFIAPSVKPQSFPVTQRISTPPVSPAPRSNYGYTPSTGAAIHTGPRGGRYYINSNGNKSYIRKK